MKKKALTMLLALCMVLALFPVMAFADAGATEMADFTAADNGAAALALLNAAKENGAADSTWDSRTKTLTLKGIRFLTAATTAVKMPDGATIVLADGSSNRIAGGDAAVSVNGSYNTKISVYGIYAEGDLTIRGEEKETGTLSVQAGAHKNTGDAWTYSAALCAKGALRIQSGMVEATGGEASSADIAFSYGLVIEDGGSLSISGGSLTAVGGKSVDTGDEEVHCSFSGGVDSYKGNIAVSGNGKLQVKCVPEMKGEGLTYGIYMINGDLQISDNAELLATATHAIYISNGSFYQTGGKCKAVHQGDIGYALSVEYNSVGGKPLAGKLGNIEISGGTVQLLDGGVYMSSYNAGEQQSMFTVSGSDTVVTAAGSIYGARVFTVDGGTVQCGRISAKTLTLTGGSLTVQEPVYEYNSTLYANSAIGCNTMTVSGGALDVSWDWGEYTPVVFPADENHEPLVKLYTKDAVAAAFLDGIAKFNTGCAGNTALYIAGTLQLGTNMEESGSVKSETDASRVQSGNAPVVFREAQQVPVIVSGVTAQNKVYDGTNTATLTAGTVEGIREGDDVSLVASDISAHFADADAGKDKAVTVDGGSFALRGADAHKYILRTQPTDLTGLRADITCATAVLADSSVLRQTLYAGAGSSFRAPGFAGVRGETVTGSLQYSCKLPGETEVRTVTAEALLPLLDSLKAGDTAELDYCFVADNSNYASDPLRGTITVTVKKRASSSGSSSYAVQVLDAQHGTVTASVRYAGRGNTVTLTAKPDSGYALETLTVTDSKGNALTLTDKTDGKYSFTMPAGKVDVKAVFAEDNSVLNAFYDVPNDAYYYELVKWAVEKDVTQGIGNGLFDPNGNCTRAQIVTFLWRAAGTPAPKQVSSFSDVPADSYYAKAVAWAVENKITLGTDAEHFSPEDSCTRAQAVTFLFRAVGKIAASKADFRDVPADSYYADAVAWAVENGVTKGTGEVQFSPEDTCTRAQIVTFLYRAYQSK